MNGLNSVCYNFYEDPGHGWLRVSVADVEFSGIQVTEFSPKKNGFYYLEEDCDASAFVKAVKAKGFNVCWEEIYLDDFYQ